MLLLGLMAAPAAAQQQQLISKGTITQGGITRERQSFIEPQSVVSEDGITRFSYDVIVRDSSGDVWNHYSARAGVDCSRRNIVNSYMRENHVNGGEENHFLVERYNNPGIERVVPQSEMATLVDAACSAAD